MVGDFATEKKAAPFASGTLSKIKNPSPHGLVVSQRCLF